MEEIKKAFKSNGRTVKPFDFRFSDNGIHVSYPPMEQRVLNQHSLSAGEFFLLDQ